MMDDSESDSDRPRTGDERELPDSSDVNDGAVVGIVAMAVALGVLTLLALLAKGCLL